MRAFTNRSYTDERAEYNEEGLSVRRCTGSPHGRCLQCANSGRFSGVVSGIDVNSPNATNS